MFAKRYMVLLVALVASVSCAAPTGPGDEEGGLGSGKADGSDYSECEKAAMTDWVNAIPLESTADEREARDTLRGVGVPGLAAKCIAWWRLGMDACPAGSLPAGFEPSLREFADASQIDDVRGTGTSTFQALAGAIGDACSAPPPPSAGADPKVIFSPQPGYEGSHAQEVVRLLNADTTRSVDIAMYSFSQAQIVAAVVDNASRIPIRVIYDRGHLGRGLEAQLEEAGIEVRTVGPTMHHKFAIFNAVHEEGDDPLETVVTSGSANWSSGAVDTYDESTVFVRNSAEMALRFQREFNRLWDRSRDVETPHDDATQTHFTTMDITEAMIAAVEDPTVDAIFTSMNFRDSTAHGLSVDRSDGYQVAARWIEAIQNAEESIWIYSERLRSVPLAEAILAKAAANPDLEIRVYADNQEYKNWWDSRDLMQDLQDCKEAASTWTQQLNCERGMYYAYFLHEQFDDNPNHELRLKYYSYNWHHSFQQMHHKSMIIDGRWIFTGSYNFSYNAEFETIENVMIFDGEAHRDLLDDFEENFDFAWHRGNSQYDEMMAVVNGDAERVPIRFVEEVNGFPPISMTWQQVDDYREAVRSVCGHAQISDLRENNERASYCVRQ